MIRVQLPATEAERQDTLFRSTDDPAFRVRLQIVLMAHRGRPRRDIAADLGVHRKTVTRWVNAYRDGGLDGLRPRKAKGTPGRIPAALAGEVRKWVIEGPAGQGLDRANWTHEEIAGHLLRARGIRTSRSAVQRFCSGIGVRLYRPTYRHLRGKPDKQAAAERELADLGNGRRPANSPSQARTRPGSRWSRRSARRSG